MNKSRIHPCVLLLVLLAAAPATASAAGTTVSGVVLGSALAPLAGVHIAADEVGVSRDTDAKGQFSLTVSPEVEQKGVIRLTFSLLNHQTYSIEVKLPHPSRLQVILNPLFARSFQPILPPDFTSRLRFYRQDEIQHVHSFLGSQEKKLLILEGLPSVDAADLLLVSLQDVPAGARKPILWWDCEETDSLALIAEEWARAFRDTNLGNLLKQRQQIQNTQGGQEQDRRDLDREIMAWLLSRLERSPHTIVLTRFDQWLAPDSQQIEDAALSDFVRRVVNHPQKGKMILVSEEKPILPRDLNPAWVEGFLVPGISIDEALDFLQNHLGLRAAPELVKQAAERLGGRPRALRLLAGSLVDLEPAEQEDRLRQFLQVGENPLPGSELRPLLESAHERLSSTEGQVLDLLAVVRQPLSADELQEIGVSRKEPLTSDEIEKVARRLVRERYWFESFQDAQTSEELFGLVEMARPFLEEKIAKDRDRKIDLHRSIFRWYKNKFSVSSMEPMILVPSVVVARYNELVRQAFTLAEIGSGVEAREATLLGSQVAIYCRNWLALRGSHRLLLSRLSWARRLLLKQEDPEASRLLADVLALLGDLSVRSPRMPKLAEGESYLKEALSFYRSAGNILGEANTLKALGELSEHAGHFSQAENYYQEAFGLYIATLEPQGIAHIYLARGELSLKMNRMDEAEKYHKEALRFYRTGDYRLGEANVLRSLGDIYRQTDRLEDAFKSYDETLRLYRSMEDRIGEANTLMTQGELYLRMYRLPEAEEHFNQALALYRSIEESTGEANTLRSLGDVYRFTDRLADAEQRYNEALRLYRENGGQLGEANTLDSLGDLFLRTHRLADAEARYQEALSLFKSMGHTLGEANTLRSIGDLRVRTYQLTEAEALYKEALTLFRSIQERMGEANTLNSLGDLYQRMDRLSDAETSYQDSLSIFRNISQRLGEAQALKSLGDLYRREGRLLESLESYEAALSLFRDLHDRLGEAGTLRAVGRIETRIELFSEAEKHYGQALTLCRAMKEPLCEANTLLALGDLFSGTERLSEAEARYKEASPLIDATNDNLGRAGMLESLGELYAKTDRLLEAEGCFLDALSLHREVRDRLGEANTLKGIGSLYARTGRPLEAEVQYEAALQLYRVVEERLGEANTLLGLARLRSDMWKYREAIDLLQEAMTIYRSIKNWKGRVDCHLALSDNYRGLGQSREAIHEVLNGMLWSAKLKNPTFKPIYYRIIILRAELGREVFDPLAESILETFRPIERDTLKEILDKLIQALEGKGSPQPTSAPDTPPPA